VLDENDEVAEIDVIIDGDEEGEGEGESEVLSDFVGVELLDSQSLASVCELIYEPILAEHKIKISNSTLKVLAHHTQSTAPQCPMGLLPLSCRQGMAKFDGLLLASNLMQHDCKILSCMCMCRPESMCWQHLVCYKANQDHM
jgi:hypothetical protein